MYGNNSYEEVYVVSYKHDRVSTLMRHDFLSEGQLYGLLTVAPTAISIFVDNPGPRGMEYIKMQCIDTVFYMGDLVITNPVIVIDDNVREIANFLNTVGK